MIVIQVNIFHKNQNTFLILNVLSMNIQLIKSIILNVMTSVLLMNQVLLLFKTVNIASNNVSLMNS